MKEVDPMDGMTALRARINVCHKSHQDPLRKLVFLTQRTAGLTLDDVVRMTVPQLATKFKGVPTSRSGSVVKDPSGMAKKVFKALAHVRTKFPHDGYPVPPDVPERRTFRQVPLQEQTEAYRNDMAAWNNVNDQVRGRETRGMSALRATTKVRYKCKHDQFLGVAMDLGFIKDQTCGIRMLVDKIVVDAVLAEFAKTHSPRTMVGTVAALLRAAVGLLGNDPGHAADIAHLKTELTDLFPSMALTAEELLELDNLALSEPFAAQLCDAPDAMAERADEPGLKPRDALSRVAAALAVEIKLTHNSTTPASIMELDTATHFVQHKGALHLLVPDPKVMDGMRLEPLTECAIRILARWHDARARAGISSTKLFPLRHGRPREGLTHEEATQEGRTALTFVTGELSAVMGHRLTFSKLKAVSLRRFMRDNPGAEEIAAETFGYHSAEAVRKRLAASINRRAA